jgi:Domain of unknown function (DUF4249)
MKKIYYALFVLAFLNSCIEEAQIPFRSESVKLVVDGGITNDTPPYTIKLSYSGNLKNSNLLNLNLAVAGAKVVVTDDLGKSIEFEQSPYERGTYRSEDYSYVGKVGRTYTLSVLLKDGRKYVSSPEKLLASSRIDSVYADFQDVINDSYPDGYQVFLDTKDPSETQNYYRWTAFAYSRVGRVCGNEFCANNCDIRNGFIFCWVPRYQTRINILSDNFVNGNPIKRRPVLFSPVYAVGKHFVEITQYSISREAFQFWKLYDEQSSRSGTIFDPLPAPIQGNIVNANDPNDFALGYFGASGVSRKRLIITGKYDQTEIFVNAKNFIPEAGGCSLPFATCDRPDGWPKD